MKSFTLGWHQTINIPILNENLVHGEQDQNEKRSFLKDFCIFFLLLPKKHYNYLVSKEGSLEGLFSTKLIILHFDQI